MITVEELVHELISLYDKEAGTYNRASYPVYIETEQSKSGMTISTRGRISIEVHNCYVLLKETPL